MARFQSVLIGDAPILVHCAEVLLARGHGIAAMVTGHAGIIDWAEDLIYTGLFVAAVLLAYEVLGRTLV